MGKKLNLLNQRFGKLLVLKESTERAKNGVVKWVCQCDCGKTSVVPGSSLKFGSTQSCGCSIGVVKHGFTCGDWTKKDDARTYRSWDCMKSRCYRLSSTNYKNYGGKGITVCDRWYDSFENFLSDMGKRPKNMTLHRCNSAGNYEPSNCVWADSMTQMENRKGTKLNYMKVQGIKALLKTEEFTQKQIGEMFSVAASVISNISRGAVWVKR